MQKSVVVLAALAALAGLSSAADAPVEIDLLLRGEHDN